MFARIVLRTIMSGLVVFGLAAAAQAEEWKVVQARGEVWIGENSPQFASLRADMPIAGGTTLTTGNNARVMLVRGTQTMVVGADSVVTLPDSDTNGLTTILQRAGKVVFDVDHQKVRHFAVETPYLAAVVKGTRFIVDVDNTGASVSVLRGLVGVTDLATGDNADTPRGQKAIVSRTGDGLEISGFGVLAQVKQGQPRRALVDPLGDDELAALGIGIGNGSSSSASANGLALGRAALSSASSGVGLAVGLGGGNSGGNDIGSAVSGAARSLVGGLGKGGGG